MNIVITEPLKKEMQKKDVGDLVIYPVVRRC